jgi:hypothetical protein
MTWPRALSILWLPAVLAIALPVTFEVAIDGSTTHKPPIIRAVTAPERTEGAGSLALPSKSGDGGIGIFFLVLPLMMSGVITAIVLPQRPGWGIGRRVALVGAVGALASLAAYLSAVGLHVVPAKPLLFAVAFLITQLASAQFLGRTTRR